MSVNETKCSHTHFLFIYNFECIAKTDFEKILQSHISTNLHFCIDVEIGVNIP